MPEVGHDALAMHLFVPAHLALRHQWSFDVSTYVWAAMPMLGDWIYGIGYVLAGETAARLINVGFIFILGGLVRDLVRWAGGSDRGARWAALIFLSTPLTFTESSSLFVESIWACFTIAGTLTLLRVCSSSDEIAGDMATAGLLLGYAMASKAITATILPVLLILLILRYRVWLRVEALRCLLIGLALFLLCGSVPYLTAILLTGNPVFPFYNKIFQSTYYPVVNFDSSTIFGKGLSWTLLYDVIFHSGKYLESRAGASGFQWLILFVPASAALVLARHSRGLTLLFIGVFAVALTFQSVSYLRYVFPSFAILAAVIGVALSAERVIPSFYSRMGYLAASAVVGGNLLFLNAGAQHGDFALSSILSDSHRTAYLEARLPIRNAVELINHLNRDQLPVAVFAAPLSAGLSADALYPNWYNFKYQNDIQSARTDQQLAQTLRGYRVEYIILDEGSQDTFQRFQSIKSITETVWQLGSVSVRQLKQEYRFDVELIRNPSFASMDGWSSTDTVTVNPSEGIKVSVSSPASQAIAVVPGRRYRNTVKAQCDSEPTLGRIQVNWLDARSRFIKTDIRVFECSALQVEQSMEVIAPTAAATAIVYASGHTATPLIFRGVSFRQ
jgi:hypothetical protein